MLRKCVVILALCYGLTSCSGQQLSRGAALHLIKEGIASRQVGAPIKAEVISQVNWDEQNWGDGKRYEVTKLNLQSEIDFLNHLVEAGVLRKIPDTFAQCNPEPDCREHNKYINYLVIPSPDVEVQFQGMRQPESVWVELGHAVLARPSNPTITGITQQGIDADVDFTFEYSPTPLFTRISQLTKEDFAKCSERELWSDGSPSSAAVGGNPPAYCRQNWPDQANIIATKKERGTIHFKRYDDGWRIVR
jgi:hypothetical protein